MSSPTWGMVPIQDFAEVVTGGTPSTTIQEYWYGGSIPWLNSGELNKGVITSADNFITSAGLENSAAQLMPEDSVLVALTGATTGVSALLKIRACANQSVTGILPSPRHHPQFLLHYIRSIRHRIVGDSWGGAQKHISQAYVKQIRVPLPSLGEQRRVADILDRSDAMRAKRRAALTQLDTLSRSMFLDMFGDPATNPKGWPRADLGELIDFVGGSQPPRDTFTFEPSPETIRLVQIRGFKSEEFKTYIPRKLAKRFFDKDDVMIGRYGPPVFQILRGLSGSYNVALIKAVPRREILKEFVFHLLQEPRLQAYVVGRSERTAGQTGVNLELLEKYPAYRPPIELQREFARRVAAIDRIKSTQRAAVSKVDALFCAIQNRAFRGELLA